MNDKNDEYYQPWLRDPESDAGRVVPKKGAQVDDGLAKPKEQPPIGLDVSRYPSDEKASRPRAPSAKSITSGTKSLWRHVRKGSNAFADWTIRIGQSADVPGRVASLEIPRRTGVLARKSASLSQKSAAAMKRTAARGARSVGATSHRLWQKMGLADKIAKATSGTGRGLGTVAGKARSGIAATAKAGKGSLVEASSKLRPTPAKAPPSGLDQLLERELEKADPGPATPDLPLFTSGKAATKTGAPPLKPASSGATTKPPSEKLATLAAQAAAPPAMTGPLLGIPHSSSARWAMVLVAALALLATSFWLGGRAGGGMTRGEVETIVASYIQSHPEMIPQALDAHRANQVAKAIDAIRPALERPYAGAWAGNANGDVSVVVFTDYACVFCRASVPDIDRLLREDKRVKVIFRELPIIAPQSREAALMALAAARQGKYDAFHHAMFASPSLDSSAIKAVAAKVGVVTDGSADATGNTALFQRELDSNIAIAQQLQLDATPTWIIGDQLLQGQLGYAGLRAAVAKARTKG